MNNTATLTAAAVLAAGLVGAAISLRPASNEAEIGARIDAATRPLAARLEKLEEDTARLSRERDAALRQGAEALSTALDARRDLDRLRDRTDDLLAALSSGGGAKVAGGKASHGGALASGPGAGVAGDGTPAAAGAVPGESNPTLVAGGPGGSGPGAPPAGAGTPQQIDQVRAAVELIRKEDAERQRAQWEQQRKKMQEKRLATFTERLGLSPSQAERVQAIWDETQARREQAFASMRDGSIAPVELKETMVQSRAEEDRRIQETLSPQQYDDYQRVQKENPQQVMFGAADGAFMGAGAVMREAVIMSPPGPAATGAGAGK